MPDTRSRRLAKQLASVTRMSMKDAHQLAHDVVTDARSALLDRGDSSHDGPLCAVLPVTDGRWQLVLLRGQAEDVRWLAPGGPAYAASGPTLVGAPFTAPAGTDVTSHVRQVVLLAGGRFELGNATAVAHLRVAPVTAAAASVLPALGDTIARPAAAARNAAVVTLRAALHTMAATTGVPWSDDLDEDELEIWCEDVLSPAASLLLRDAPAALATVLADGSVDAREQYENGLASAERDGWSIADLLGGLSPRSWWPDLLCDALPVI
jgi:hypothetical protein